MFSARLLSGHVVHIVYRNLADDIGVDYLVHHPERTDAVSLAVDAAGVGRLRTPTWYNSRVTYRFIADVACGFDNADEDDALSGHPDQGTAYGCVREVTIAGDVLRVVLDPASLAALDLEDPVVEAELRAPAADVARFREVLRRILAFGRSEARPAVVGL